MKHQLFKNKLLKSRYLLNIALIATGILIGWLFFHTPDNRKGNQTNAPAEVKESIWTCSMDPQVRMPGPGKCPICGMDLIPLVQSSGQADGNSVHLTNDAAALANVLTTVVSKQNPVKEVRLYGKILPDERLLQSQVSYFPGRIEKLFVNFTGETVSKGQPLGLIYSPELVTAQQELLEAAGTKQSQPEIYNAAREKLLQWKLTVEQIKHIEETGSIINNFEVVATTSGIITSRLVSTGQFITQGTVLFQVADLSQVWAVFDAYENDVTYIKKGDDISFSVQAIPGKSFRGRVSFVDPVLDPVTRVAKVRVELANTEDLLKPEMFATGVINAGVSENRSSIVIPRTAVLWTGKRSIVYVRQPGSGEPVFQMREIVLGPSLGESYVVTDGLAEGEEIVTSGAFSVDAAAQLEGKKSMMNQE
jgi:membrane fusion protein, copper/silver efflux system